MGSVGDIVGTMVKPVVWNLRYHFPNMFVRTFMFGMVGSLAMFITSWEKADRLKDNYLDKNRNYGETFDFIVGKCLYKVLIFAGCIKFEIPNLKY